MTDKDRPDRPASKPSDKKPHSCTSCAFEDDLGQPTASEGWEVVGYLCPMQLANEKRSPVSYQWEEMEDGSKTCEHCIGDIADGHQPLIRQSEAERDREERIRRWASTVAGLEDRLADAEARVREVEYERDFAIRTNKDDAVTFEMAIKQRTDKYRRLVEGVRTMTDELQIGANQSHIMGFQKDWLMRRVEALRTLIDREANKETE